MKANKHTTKKTFLLFSLFFLFIGLEIVYAADFKILVFHKTNGYRHNGAINSGITMLEDLGINSTISTWDVDNTTDASVFTSTNLAQYDVIVFLCTSGGGLLNASQKAAMESFIQSGKGFVGFHSATDTYRNTDANSQWLWYNDLVGGIVQESPYHTPNNTTATMTVMTDHPTIEHIGPVGSTWTHDEEWYYWEQNGGQVSSDNIVLLEVGSTGANSYDAPRAITWHKEYDGGRSFYTALGHNGSTYQNDVKFRTMSEKAILYAASIIDSFDDCGNTLTSNWTDLLANGLDCWEKWMGVPHSTTGLPGSSSNVTNGSGTPLGLNNDPTNVFSIVNVNYENQLYITGEVYGGLTTLSEYSDYHFTAQYKWGTQKWEPRLYQLRDSGILYHCTGSHGVFWDVWKSCLEYQVQEGDLGDYIGLGTASASIISSGGTFDPENGTLTSGNGLVRADQDLELPNGQWNTIDILVIGDRAIHYINGVMVNALEDAKMNGVTVTQGQIQIQSEAAEMWYRDIKIKSITEFPQVDTDRLGWTNGGTNIVCDTDAPIGDTISLRKIDGDQHWLTIDPSSTVISADAISEADADLFVIEAHPLGCVAFKSVATGKYIQVKGNSTTAAIEASGNAAGTWEQFGWKDKGINQVAIKSLYNGGWLQADWTVNDVAITPAGSTDSDYETFGYFFDICPYLDDALIGTSCDDGDVCTINDVYTSACVCAGTFADTDTDGICDADDICTGFDDNLIGTACDDGDPCTINDVYTSACECQSSQQIILDPPTGLTLISANSTSIILSWPGDSNSESYNLRYRNAAIGGSWTNVSTTVTSAIITELDECTDYEMEVSYQCDLYNQSGFSATELFSTTSCFECTAPTGLYQFNIQNSSAILTWDVSVGVSSYNYKFRKIGNPNWTASSTTFPIVILFGIDSCTDYEWTMETTCYDGSATQSSTVSNLTTLCKNDDELVSENIEMSELLAVYPNPASKMIQVQIPTYHEGYEIQILNIHGQLVSAYSVAEELTFIDIDISELDKAVYLIRYGNEYQTFIKK